MKHLSCTSEPAITCFSCWPSTETDGTEMKISILMVVPTKVNFIQNLLNKVNIPSCCICNFLAFLFFKILFNIYSPTTVSLKTWLILGFVETWHSKSPASEAFVNLSLRVFWPRLRLIHVLFQTFSENITSLPSRHKVKALITNVFLFSYVEWVTIICTHPRHLKEKKVMGMLSVISRFSDFWKDFAKTLHWWWSILILCRGALCARPKLHNFILFTIYKQ